MNSTAPIHGISLEGYASMTYYLASGMEPDVLFAKMKIDANQWNEVDIKWRERMNKDDSFLLITRYSQYYNEAEKYIKFDETDANK